MFNQDIINFYRKNGFAIIEDFYSPEYISNLIFTLTDEGVFEYNFADNDSHNLFNSQGCIRQLASSEELSFIARTLIGDNAIPFYAIVLDKTKENNWELDWHQDLKIVVKEKKETHGYYNWSIESNITNVIPPVKILEKLLYIRIHLDDCDDTNGAISVLPGTHTIGIIDDLNLSDTVKQNIIYDCRIKRGAIMLMSPLLVHKSPYSLTTKKRRVLQLEYRAVNLDGELQWYN